MGHSNGAGFMSIQNARVVGKGRIPFIFQEKTLKARYCICRMKVCKAVKIKLMYTNHPRNLEMLVISYPWKFTQRIKVI